jgi:hypothetical protein
MIPIFVLANQNPILIENSVIEAPILPGRPDVCEYSCRSNGGCSVAFKTQRIVSGASLVSLFIKCFSTFLSCGNFFKLKLLQEPFYDNTIFFMEPSRFKNYL